MNCPVCHEPDLDKSTKSCPKCSSDLELLTQIKITRKLLIRKNNTIALLSILLVIAILSAFYLSIKAKSTLSGEKEKVSRSLTKEEKVSKNQQYTLDMENQQKAAVSDTIKSFVDATKKSESHDNNEKNQNAIEHIVKKNDNLWRLAITYYQDGYKYQKIAHDNNIENPELLKIGQTIIIYEEHP